MIRTETFLDQDRRTDGNCVSRYAVECRVIVDNNCEFQHSSSHGDCNFDARLARNTRTHQQTNIYKIRQDFTDSGSTQKKEDTFTSRRVWNVQNSSVLQTNPVRQLSQMHFVQSIQSVGATNCSCTNTAKS